MSYVRSIMRLDSLVVNLFINVSLSNINLDAMSNVPI
jgi:hypothetical protein